MLKIKFVQRILLCKALRLIMLAQIGRLVLIKIRVCRRVVRRHRLIEAWRLLTLHAQRRLLGLILLLDIVQPPHGQPELPTSRDRRLLFQFDLTIKRVLDLSTGLLNH